MHLSDPFGVRGSNQKHIFTYFELHTILIFKFILYPIELYRIWLVK